MPNPKPWTAVERAEAVAMCDELLCTRTPPKVIIQTIAKAYLVEEGTAKRVLKEAEDGLRAVLAERAPFRRAQLLAGLDRLYEKACRLPPSASSIKAAAGVQELIAKVEGHLRPVKVEISDATSGNQFANRSDAECDYYAEHGHFPDEAPQAGKQPPAPDAAPRFPLH